MCFQLADDFLLSGRLGSGLGETRVVVVGWGGLEGLGKLPTVRQSYLQSGEASYCQACTQPLHRLAPTTAYMNPKVSIDLRPTTAYFAPNNHIEAPTTP